MFCKKKLTYTFSFKTSSSYLANAKYCTRDDFEISNTPLATADTESDTESLDSVILAKKSNQIKQTSKSFNKQTNKQTEDDEENADEINKALSGVAVGRAEAQDDDEDEKSEYELSPVSKLRLKKKKKKILFANVAYVFK